MKKILRRPVLYNVLAIILFMGILTALYFVSKETLIQKQTQILTLDRDVAASEIENEFTKISSVIYDIDSYITSEEDLDNLIVFMENVAEDYDFVSAIYLGIPDNPLLITPDIYIPPTFDLTQRPWYLDATSSDGVVFTDAFLDVSEDKYIVTAAKSVYIDGQFYGVIGIDIDLETITQYFYTTSLEEGNYSFLVDNNGNLLTYNNSSLNNTDIESLDSIGINLELFSEPSGITDKVLVNSVIGNVAYKTIPGTNYIYGLFMPSIELTQNLNVFLTIGVVFLALVSIIGVSIYLIYIFYIQRPLKNLIGEINLINSDDTYKHRLSTSKDQGFIEARMALNELLDTTYNYQNQALSSVHDLALRNQKYNLLLDSASDIVFQIDKEGKYIEVYGRGLKSMKKTESDFYGKNIDGVFSNLSNKIRVECYNSALKGRKSTFSWEYEIDERIIYYETVMSPLFNVKGTIIGVVGVTRDITEQELRYQDMVQISTHDYLTGLNNRRYYIENLEVLDRMREYPFAVMNIDVNGLKIINDAYGHSVGDEALIKTAKVLKENVKDTYMVSRISGDEFTIILPNCDDEETLALKIKLLEAFRKVKVSNLNLSVAIGYHVKRDYLETIDDVRKLAENDMFRHKISERKSVKNKAISAILKTLTDKFQAEKDHSDIVSKYSRKMGEVLNLAADELNELTTAAMFHDIGKISIPDEIINKPGKLTDREFEIMKSHTEVGYEILRAADEYSDLAIYASSHHEKWDGTGYPRGLKGQNIPLFSRIISLADSYEAMTSDRPYREKQSIEYAVSEIIKYAGTQFDPELARIFVEKVLKRKWTTK